MADEEDYANLHEEYSSTPDEEESPPVTKQPGGAMAMPPPDVSENTTLTTDGKPTYGADTDTVAPQPTTEKSEGLRDS